MKIVSARQWNPQAQLTRQYLEAHPDWRPLVSVTVYEEVANILGTSGVSDDGYAWDWSVLGVIVHHRGVLFVSPGDWVVFLEHHRVPVICSNAQYLAHFRQYAPRKVGDYYIAGTTVSRILLKTVQRDGFGSAGHVVIIFDHAAFEENILGTPRPKLTDESDTREVMLYALSVANHIQEEYQCYDIQALEFLPLSPMRKALDRTGQCHRWERDSNGQLVLAAEQSDTDPETAV